MFNLFTFSIVDIPSISSLLVSPLLTLWNLLCLRYLSFYLLVKALFSLYFEIFHPWLFLLIFHSFLISQSISNLCFTFLCLCLVSKDLNVASFLISAGFDFISYARYLLFLPRSHSIYLALKNQLFYLNFESLYFSLNPIHFKYSRWIHLYLFHFLSFSEQFLFWNSEVILIEYLNHF